MRITCPAGGIGGARFITGLRDHLRHRADSHAGASVEVIANTGDDIRVLGLQVCPDLDTLMYTLGDGISRERGWGREDESWVVKDELAHYGAGPSWFGLGDRDLATHLVRTSMLDAGWSLTEVTAALCERWQPGVRLLPMCDERVETHVIVEDDDGRRALHFQEWWVRHRAGIPAQEFVLLGADKARPTAAVLEAWAGADVILLPPSNPVVSIGTVLEVPGMREAMLASPAPIIGISPIIGGQPVRGMADACLAAVGVETSAAAVALHYGARSQGGLLDGWIVDDVDEAAVAVLTDAGIPTISAPTLMAEPIVAERLAAEALAFAHELRAR